MTQEMLDNLPEKSIPEDYILMAQESDITDAVGGNYLSILFSAIRSLQAEVAKLRNSFEFGIESYTNKQTAVSGVVHDITESESEPLWAIDETTLSGIPEATIDFYAPTVPLLPNLNVHYTAEGFAEINGNAFWTDDTGYSEIEDTKIFLYTTTTSTDINVNLTGIESNQIMTIPLQSVLNAFGGSKYNICVLVSRKMKVDDDEHEYGKNYIWITASDFYSNITIAEGFYNPTTQKLQTDMFEIDDKFTISSVQLTNLTITKFNAYSQYQDFSHEVIAAKPSDQDYKYKAAHLTIRKVDTLDELEEVESRLLNNELIYQEDKGILWIKTKNGLRAIGSGDHSDTGMTVTEMIEELEKRGLIYKEGNTWKVSDFSDVTFVHNDTRTRFKFEVSADGQLKGQELPIKTLEQIMNGLSTKVSTDNEPRGFIGKLHLAQTGQTGSYAKDAKLNSDRVKIGAVYCPLKEDTKHGCSHGYIELENTSDQDIPLEGCYLHFLHPNDSRVSTVDSLALTGILPAGGTYLVRCKKYADPNIDADVFIDVKNYDQEWYKDGELLDLAIDQEYVIVEGERQPSYPYDFALTYGNLVNNSPISASTVFMTKQDNVPVYVWNFIDSLLIDKKPNNANGWGPNVAASRSNTIIRNTFELDPAKQAYQALYEKDSSRLRLAKIDNDIQYLDLSLDKIQFPLTEDTYEISKFTPKASFEHKNVCSDKSKIDYDKPNMVTCSFGINMYTTRCFNWISAGEFDEYVFIKNGNSWNSFQSYTEQSGVLEQENTFPRRKEFPMNITNSIYKRIVGDFPGDGSHYTAHKCIVEVIENALTSSDSPVTYTYIVGRKDANGNPDLEHCSEEQTFTLYPTSYIPRIYQITDQQGFHWIEYQVWAAAAKAINDKINSDLQNDNVIPVLINTGDMTQNGTRINEWFDYYQAGRCLFNHLEQMNVVGNNDLCNTDVNALGTGDDNGKSNGFYFHVFYCYEVDPSNAPLIFNGTKDLYVPSLYHFDSLTYSFVMINSEITYVNCDKWFNRHKDGKVVNVYTGWEIPENLGDPVAYDGTFTSIYTMVYNMISSAKTNSKNVIAVCHEMPYTVITKDSLQIAQANARTNPRSIGGTGTSLIGSHTNQLTYADRVGMHWLSRLLEYFEIKLMIGGHKHTYACTFPVRENYKYYALNGQGEIDRSTELSSLDSPMTMYSTLEKDDRVNWLTEEDGNTYHTSKLPYTPYKCTGDAATGSITAGGQTLYTVFTPARYVHGLTGGVTYLMCQATGYKLTSNKELPTNYQLFSNLIPKTTVKSDGSDGPDNNQKRPMFIIVDMLGNTYTAQLIRINGILNSSYGFTQINNTPKDSIPSFEWATIPAVVNDEASGRYATWSSVKSNLISI